jgi:myo-inositol 2-dehydrogenase/D-chiro-inositol 1-dehydrogenase
MHADHIINAVRSGKDVFCEKPIDLALETAQEVSSEIQKSGVKFMLGFNRRFDPNFEKIKSLITEGKIGDPQLVKITSRDPAPPPLEYIEISGGLFRDMMIHDFDTARWLLGEEPRSLHATASCLVDPAIGAAGDVDTAITTMRLTGGALAVIDNSRKAVYGYDQRVEVFGSEGMVAASNNLPDAHVYSNANGVHTALPLHFFLERYMDSYVAEMREFVDAVLNDEEPPVVGVDGRIPVVMGLAAQKSWRENRAILLNVFGDA